ncbi:putative CDP-alcohol phosphatidyltransferase class-I family protein C22A12.08c [Sesamum angolense]|uniref:CDP-alcohol phosphatidyltransferase class-I family protein C22A12.08c n=1 Tax=Sesamum angolense TaxID=2727404 RepID=A0AAE1W313_9LAMI|nr:putative CDP-alcohol phosphatidyltransferase class-I family protein C22A12.08c [Sesamum angolense]
MDKEGKKKSSKEKGNNLPPRRGQIKGKILEDWKETLRGGWKRGDHDECGGSNTIKKKRKINRRRKRKEYEVPIQTASAIVFAPAAASGCVGVASFSTEAVVSSFGIAFDIDGVILRGTTPIGNSRRALRRLYDDSGAMNTPFLFLTNGRARSLTFRTLLKRYENEFIVATGKGEPAVVMSEYGFKRVISLEEYASQFKNIDPVAQYKRWTTNQELNCSRNSEKIASTHIDCSQKVKAAFVVSDPVDWGRDIQSQRLYSETLLKISLVKSKTIIASGVAITAIQSYIVKWLCDILTSGGVPGEENGQQPPLYFAADDLQYQAAFPSERLGMGAFRIALESVFNSPGNVGTEDVRLPSFKTLYMIGDNPLVDVKGAQQTGYPWFSILTRTGVFRQRENHTQYPADMVVDTVEDAWSFILKREDASYVVD